MVGEKGLEPIHPKVLVSKTSAASVTPLPQNLVPEVGLEPTRYLNFATASQAAVASITPSGLKWRTRSESNRRMIGFAVLRLTVLATRPLGAAGGTRTRKRWGLSPDDLPFSTTAKSSLGRTNEYGCFSV